MLDKQGKPRSGMARANFANKVHGGQHGPGASEKNASPAKMSEPPAAPGKREESEADAAMTAHSHKGGADDVSKMPIHDVVKQHGPATHVASEHDHQAGKHHVHTKHGSKHHHSDHETNEMAQDHMSAALGGMSSPDEVDEDHLDSPFEGTQSDEEEALEDQVSHGKAHKGMGLA